MTGLAATEAVEATFLAADPPRSSRLALWGKGVDEPDDTVELVLPAGSQVRRRRLPARSLAMTEAIPMLVALGPDGASTPSLAAWAAAAKAATVLVARGRLTPAVTREGFDTWRVGPLDPADHEWFAQLLAAFPPAAHAAAQPGSPAPIPSASATVSAFLDAVADTLARSPATAAVSAHPAFAAIEPTSVPGLATWLAEATTPLDAGGRVGLRLELPESADEPLRAVLQLTSRADPSLVVDASDLWSAPAVVVARFGDAAEADLFLSLRHGAAAWPPLGRLLDEPDPTALVLGDEEAAELLGPATEALAAAGIDVLLPAELAHDRPTVRAVVATPTPSPDAPTGFGLDELLSFRWEVAVGGEALTDAEVGQLAEAKRPLVRLRGRWVVADATLIDKLRRRRRRQISAGEALGAVLGGGLTVDGEDVDVRPDPGLAAIAGQLKELTSRRNLPEGEEPEPPGLHATLRHYQRQGLGWLTGLGDLGLGGCLADDMGLGKTITVIALHLSRRDGGRHEPMLVVCPASVLGNWERELHRFAPDVPVRRFHGGGRHLDDLAPGEVVLATYGVVRRDREALAEVGWGVVVADEAQHVKNPLARTAKELRAIPAQARVALTGTPVENRLTELWAILDWAVPGLLGPLDRFRRDTAVPVERYRDPEATARLTGAIAPFLLRRRKTDPGVAPELPPKTETDRPVALTTEQATLYQAVVREGMEAVTESEGMARRGLVLKLLTALKQVCNHPAHYLGQPGPLAGRSGKLAALDDLVDVIVDEGESVLVFTQYVAMARLLESHLAARGTPALFLHGGLGVRRRDELVARFQAGEVPVFLLSLKAGGTGLNLTQATHVIHYDRWWNPAVEDQASDRAWRIGQDRPVQVHRLLCEGTLEERIAQVMERKRDLASAVVGDGEGWLSELDDDELAALVTLESRG